MSLPRFRRLLVVSLAAAAVTSAAAAQAVESGELFPVHGNASEFGASLDVEGARALVGNHQHSHAPFGACGAAGIYELQPDGTWAAVQELLSGDPALLDTFGRAVALAGGIALVAASGDDSPGGSDQGAAYVFERQTNGTWVQAAKLTATDAVSDDLLGWSVALSPDGLRAAAGAIGKDDSAGGLNCGAVYLWERQANGVWLPQAKIVAGDAMPLDNFGYRVALTDGQLLVGAPTDVATGVSSGSVYVYDWPAAFVHKLVPNDASGLDWYGSSIDARGSRLVVGASSHNAARGAAYLYERTGNTWSQVAKLVASDAAAGTLFGDSVSIDGDRVVAGSPNVHPPTTVTNRGQAYLFRRQLDGTWPEISKLLPIDAQNTAQVGSACAVSGDRILLGARIDNGFTGATYAFRDGGPGYSGFGTGTPGCDGAQVTSTTAAQIGGPFTIRTTSVKDEPVQTGLGLIANVAHVPGVDLFGLGFLLHVDLLSSTFLQSYDAPGYVFPVLYSSTTFAIPNDPTLVGATLVAQSVWYWEGFCPALPHPAKLSSSSAASFTILAP